MLGSDAPLIFQQFERNSISATDLDTLLENGWRHFGTYFYRYSFNLHQGDFRAVLPLRIRLADFSMSKSQRRVRRRNEDLQTLVRLIEITAEVELLFERHKKRFREGVPDSIYEFLSDKPDVVPIKAREVAVYRKDELVAVSYFDIADRSTSGIYAIFEPAEKTRSLGIFTLLKEIEYAIACKKEFYYLGYCYEGESFYDYKKRFRATEYFDWSGNWKEFS